MLRDILFLAKAVHQIGLVSFESLVFYAGIVDKVLWWNPEEKVKGKKI